MRELITEGEYVFIVEERGKERIKRKHEISRFHVIEDDSIRFDINIKILDNYFRGHDDKQILMNGIVCNFVGIFETDYKTSKEIVLKIDRPIVEKVPGLYNIFSVQCNYEDIFYKPKNYSIKSITISDEERKQAEELVEFNNKIKEEMINRVRIPKEYLGKKDETKDSKDSKNK